MNLSTAQFALLSEVSAIAGVWARADFIAEGTLSNPCVAIDTVDLKTVWNLSSLLAERDQDLSRAMRGPAVEINGRHATLFWPGVTAR